MDPAPYRHTRTASGVRQRPSQWAPTSQCHGELAPAATPSGSSSPVKAVRSSRGTLSWSSSVKLPSAAFRPWAKGSLGSCSVLRLMLSGVGGIVTPASPSRCVGVKKGSCRAIGKG